MLDVGCEEDVEGDWERVIVMVRWEGKSEGWGDLVGIFRENLGFVVAGTYGRVSIEFKGLA